MATQSSTTARCSSCQGEPITFAVTALARGAAIFGTNRRATYYAEHRSVVPPDRLVVHDAVDGLNHTATIAALLDSGLPFHALSKRPAWRWGTLACWLTKFRLLEWAKATPGFVVMLEEDVVLEPRTFCEFVARACARFKRVKVGVNGSAAASAAAATGGEWWPTVLQMSTYAEVFMVHSEGAARLVRGLRRHGIRRAADQQLFDPMQQTVFIPTDSRRRLVLRYRGRELGKQPGGGGAAPFSLARVANTGDIMSTPRMSWAEAALLRLQTVPAARHWRSFGNPVATDTLVFHDSGQYDGRFFARYARLVAHELRRKTNATSATRRLAEEANSDGTSGPFHLNPPREHAREAPSPFVALGVISASTATGARRRAAARDSWLRLAPTTSFVVRFVLRCGGLSDARRSQLMREDVDRRVLCADGSISALEGRERGPLFALAWWLRYALAAFPSATFVAKSDSDVWLHLPDIELQLRAIPNATAPFAWHGCFGFFSLVHLAASHPHGPQYAFRGFAPTFGHARAVFRKYAAPVCAAAPGDGPHLCAGPFPFAFGSFTALGRGAAHVLVHAPGFQQELGSLHTLIQAAPATSDNRVQPPARASSRRDQRQPLATEDVWLGACLWRYVGQAAPMALYSLASEQGHLYSDESSFRVRPYTALWQYVRVPQTHGAWHLVLVPH